MDFLPETLERTADELRRRGIGFAIVGGLAVGAHTEPRFTKDVDLAVDVASDRDAEQLIQSLFGRGFGLVAQLENRHSRRLRAVRLELVRMEDSPIVDLLFAASGIESEVVETAVERPVFSGVAVKVARPVDLIAMKLLAMESPNRKFDRIDVEALLSVIDETDLAEVRDRLLLITERGWNRDRDLESDLDRLLADVNWPACRNQSEFDA